MQIFLLSCSVVGIFLSLLLLPSCSKASDSVIDLRDLYSSTEKPKNQRWDETGNFIEMTDGTILFFHPSLRQMLRSIIAEESAGYRSAFQIYSPSTKKTAVKVLDIRASAGSLEIDHWKAKESELDRLKISPEWQRIYEYTSSLYPGDADYRSGLANCSIVRLKGSHFLITGGGANNSNPGTEKVASTARIYDASARQVIKTFALKQGHRLHNSVRLTDGRVLLLGTYNVRTLELVDPISGTSRILSCQFGKFRWCFTTCLDLQGNCIVMGGQDYSVGQPIRTVEKIDITKEVITPLRDLDSPRCFMVNYGLYPVDQDALALPNNSVLVSSGFLRMGKPIGSEVHPYAEIYKLDGVLN